MAKNKLHKRGKVSNEHVLRHSIVPDGRTLRPLCPCCGNLIPDEEVIDQALIQRQLAKLPEAERATAQVQIRLLEAGEIECENCGTGLEFNTLFVPTFSIRIARKIKIATSIVQP